MRGAQFVRFGNTIINPAHVCGVTRAYDGAVTVHTTAGPHEFNDPAEAAAWRHFRGESDDRLGEAPTEAAERAIGRLAAPCEGGPGLTPEVRRVLVRAVGDAVDTRDAQWRQAAAEWGEAQPEPERLLWAGGLPMVPKDIARTLGHVASNASDKARGREEARRRQEQQQANAKPGGQWATPTRPPAPTWPHWPTDSLPRC